MVEWHTLDEICSKITDGSHFSPKSSENGFFMPSVKDMTENGFNFESCKKISQEDYQTLVNTGCKPKVGDVLIAKDGSMLKYVFPVFEEREIVLLSSIAIITPRKEIVNSSYLSHYLRRDDVKEKTIREYSSKGGVPRIILKNFKKIEIPLPSIAEQERIVSILNTFTASIDNLKRQIAHRYRQFEKYRDQLLELNGRSSNDIHAWGEFCEMTKGNGVQKTDFIDDGIGCIHYGQIYTHYGSFTYTTNKYVSRETFEKARKASKGDIIMTDTSENVEDICKSVAYLGEEDIAVSNHALIIKHQQNPKFLSYSTQTRNFFNQKRKVAFGVKVTGIKAEHLAQIKIYLPSLPEQERIVSILDTFEANISNLQMQLEYRQKQYEYYRNKLLTFE